MATNSKGAARGALSSARAIDGRQEVVDRRVEQRVLDLRADGGKDRAGDDAGRDDAEAPRLCGGDGLGGGLHEVGSGHRRRIPRK